MFGVVRTSMDENAMGGFVAAGDKTGRPQLPGVPWFSGNAVEINPIRRRSQVTIGPVGPELQLLRGRLPPLCIPAAITSS